MADIVGAASEILEVDKFWIPLVFMGMACFVSMSEVWQIEGIDGRGKLPFTSISVPTEKLAVCALTVLNLHVLFVGMLFLQERDQRRKKKYLTTFTRLKALETTLEALPMSYFTIVLIGMVCAECISMI